VLLYRFPQAIKLVIMKENSDLNIDNCQRGMTLIELLVVILIAGILTVWG